MLAEIFILRLEAMLRASETSRSGKELSVRSARRRPYCPNWTRSDRFTKKLSRGRSAGTARQVIAASRPVICAPARSNWALDLEIGLRH
jgi:hypothetical protein